MSNALQDQLLKAGLTTKKKVKKQNQAKHKKAKQQKKHTPAELDESKRLAQKAEQEKRNRDRLLNQQKESLAKQKAIIAQIKQLIDTSKIDISQGEIAYNFNDNNVVKRLYVTNKLPEQIASGKVAIVKLSEKYLLVPAIVAHKIKDRDASYIIVLNDQHIDDAVIDDEYAKYEIPDDLMW